MKRYLTRGIAIVVCVLHGFIDLYAYHEKPIVVVIPSYNNKQWYKKNIQSIAEQQYQNYRVVYINDCSTDGTGDLVRAYVQELGISDRWTIIDNPVRCGALANLYYAIHACNDHEIIVTVDADDWLASRSVLARVNQAYQNENTWMTYGQHKTYNDNKNGFCRDLPKGIIKNNFIREYDWVTSHLRTFYAGLFKKIKLKDLLYKGYFFEVSGDMAFLYPMLEMSSFHSTFIPDVLYVYNIVNSLNDFKKKLVQQISCKYFIQSRDKYSPVAVIDNASDTSVTLVVFSDGDMHELRGFFDSIKAHARYLHDVKILYKSSAEHIDPQASHRHMIQYGVGKDLQHALLQLLDEDDSAYIIFARDRNRLHQSCVFLDCVRALAQTHGHALHLSVGSDASCALPSMVSISSKYDIYAWQYKYGGFDFKNPYDIDMTIYKKTTIRSALQNIVFDTPERMVKALNSMQFDYENIGLCFEKSKAKRSSDA